jgi:hypothetical protein
MSQNPGIIKTRRADHTHGFSPESGETTPDDRKDGESSGGKGYQPLTNPHTLAGSPAFFGRRLRPATISPLIYTGRY